MESALAEIEFLALSPNRVTVLSALAAGHHTRSELADRTGASQATLGRILADFEDRAWVRRESGGYVATATGRLVAEGFDDLLGIVETERDLRGIVDYLPTDAIDFDLRELAAATITTPTQTRPNAPLQRLVDMLSDADTVSAFSHTFNDQSLGAVQEQVREHGQTFRGVFSRTAIETLADDPGLRDRLVALLSADGAEIRLREERIPLAAMVTDDVVFLLLRDEDGILRAGIDTDAGAVRAWADETFDHYWSTATPLAASDLEH
ncbi:helix-turn-helix transcriptional regulator [Halomicroarcula sp. GCM10025709]|uniref:helix-turn-helix transcriptional regulator n=1 Tax=Haloarcula TaxID=2237 RepID=UPI0024C45374|nr:MarR family transcriptional regulator [Halomicroarcula sp. YJ-61-S]